MFYTTVISSIIAMLIAVPIAIGVALFVTYYAPKRLAQPVAYAVDLLAAVPSIIYGLWGILFFAPILRPVIDGLLSTHSAGSRCSRSRRATTSAWCSPRRSCWRS